MSPNQTPVAGDRVGVPWGLDVLEGVILRTYETGAGIRAVVLVDVPGADDDPNSRTVTLPAADLLPVGEGHELEAPGSWVSEYQFAKLVQAALIRIVRRLQGVKLDSEPRLGGLRFDAIIRAEGHLVVVEVKESNVPTAAAIDQLAFYIREVRERNDGASVSGLLVHQFELPAHYEPPAGIAAVRWNSRDDDPKLAAALTGLLQ